MRHVCESPKDIWNNLLCKRCLFIPGGGNHRETKGRHYWRRRICQSGDIVNYIKLKDKVELTAIVDMDDQGVKQNVEAYGFRHEFTDYNEMFANVELDAVSICTAR